MRIFFAAWITFLASRKSIDAFSISSSHTNINGSIISSRSTRDDKSNQVLKSLATRSEDEEKVAGKVLEGGKVIDFESTRGPSKAENALKLAKEEVANGMVKEAQLSDKILGINSDVIAEVGHDLGIFASDDGIQKCAAYLRSQAKDGFFEKRSGSVADTYDDVNESMSISKGQISEMKKILSQAFVESGEVTSAFAKTFYLGTQLMPESQREAIWAIYVWCRRTDEIVDAPRDNDEEMLTDLGVWEMRLESLWKYGEVEDVFDLCLLDVQAASFSQNAAVIEISPGLILEQLEKI